MKTIPTLSDIRAAHKRVQPFIKKTPVITSQKLNKLFGCELYFKNEGFQPVGAFKQRGAANTVLQLSEAQQNAGVATHSSGNHAQAVAFIAKELGIKAHIVMPSNAPKPKVEGVKFLGGEIEFCEPTSEAREAAVAAYIIKTGATEVHPFNNLHVVEGQATVALEFLEEIPELECLWAPVGGGGLLSGTALSTHYIKPNCFVFGAEPLGASDTFHSFKLGYRDVDGFKPNTIADGLRTPVGVVTYPIIKKYVSDIYTAKEESIIRAMKLMWEHLKVIVEPSGAVPLAAILDHVDELNLINKKIGIIISGSNIDLDHIPW